MRVEAGLPAAEISVTGGLVDARTIAARVGGDVLAGAGSRVEIHAVLLGDIGVALIDGSSAELSRAAGGARPRRLVTLAAHTTVNVQVVEPSLILVCSRRQTGVS